MGEAELSALLQTISTLCPKGDLIIDDRPRLTIGRKLLDLRRLGVPFAVVAKVKVSVTHLVLMMKHVFVAHQFSDGDQSAVFF